MASFPINLDLTPAVNPTGAPADDLQRMQPSADAFGAAVGRATEGFGNAVQKASNVGFDVLMQQQEIDARTHAAELHSWQSDKVTDAQSEFLSLKGRAALEALQDFKKKIDEIGNEARSQAGNPATAQIVTSEGRRLTDVAYSGAARHAASQRAAWEATTAKNSAASYGNQAVLLASQSPLPAIADDLTVTRTLFSSDQETRNLYASQGYDGEALEQAVAANRGSNVENIVKQIANDGSPEGLKRAFDFYKSQEDKIDAAHRVQIQNVLKGPLNTIAGQKIADEAMGRPPDRVRPEAVADIPANFISAIKSSEGYAAKAKWDYKQSSNGFGTKALTPDEVIDLPTANARFKDSIGSAAKFVDTVNPNLDPGTRAALTSLTYNTGQGWADAGLGAAIRAGDMAKAKDLFLQYNKAGGETNEGLVQRRAREASWFGRGDIAANEAGNPRLNKGDVMLKIMDDPDLINRPQVQAAALAHVNKVYSAWDLQTTQASAAFKLKLQNTTAEALDTGNVANPIPREEFIQNLGGTEGDKAFAEYQANVQLGTDVRSVANLPPADVNALRERYKPQPGENYIAQQKRLGILDKAIGQVQTEKDEDPASFTIRRTDTGAAAYRQFQALMSEQNATPELRAQYAALYADKMRAEQLRLGVAPDKVRLLPQVYIDQLNTKLTSPQASGGSLPVVQQIDAEAKLWGTKNWPDVYRQMSKEAQPVIRVIGSGIKPEAAQDLVGAAHLTLPMILKSEDTEKQKKIHTDVLAAFKPLADSMAGNEGALTVFNDFRGQAEKLAAIYTIRGMTSTDAATKAWNQMVGFKYDFQNGYRVPKDAGYKMPEIAAGAGQAMFDISKLNILPARDNFGGLTSDYLQRETESAIRRDGKWVTSPDEKGLMLTYGDRAVRNRDGKPIILPWGDLAAMGRETLSRSNAWSGIQP